MPLRRLALTFLCLCLCVVFASAQLSSQPLLLTSFGSFVDVNHNGVLDCGEPVTIFAAFSNGPTNPRTLQGSLFVPSAGSDGLIFQAGSLQLEPDLTVGCDGTVVRGNVQDDVSGQLDFHCAPAPSDNGAWIVVVSYRAIYANGQFPSFTAAAHVTASDGTTYDNAFTKSTADSCGGPPSRLAVTKSSSGPGTPGSVLLSTITARDLSGLGDGGLRLVETVPSNTRFDAAASSPGWVCQPDGNPGSLCSLAAGNVDPNGTISRFFATTINSTLPAGTSSIVNTACVQEGAATIAGCATATAPTAGSPVLHLTKTLASGNGAPGSTLVYRLSASNPGNEDLASATLTETVPQNTTFSASASDPGWTCAPGIGAGATCTLSLGGLPAGSPPVGRSFALLVDNPLPAGVTSVGNTACAHAPGTADACDTSVVPTSGQPLLKVAKSLISGTAVPGTNLVYDIAIQNTGNQGVAGATASEVVPANTTFVASASSSGWSCSPSSAAGSTCTLALVGPAAGATLHASFALAVAKPLPAGITSIANTACASLPGSAPTCSLVTVPTGGHPVLSLSKLYQGGPVRAGATLSFSLSLSNSGDQDAAGATVTETVPAHTQLSVAASSPGWTCSPGNGPGATCRLAIGSLGAGSTITETFAVVVDPLLPDDVRSIANTACLQEASGLMACGQAATPLPLSVVATLRDDIAGDFNPTARPGDTITYTLVVSNPSQAAATDLEIPTTLDSHSTLEVGSVTTSSGVVTVGNRSGDLLPSVHLASLDPGASVTIVFRATVASTLPPDLRLLSSQANVRGTNIDATVSSDPDNPVPLSPTTTPVASALTVHTIPTLGSVGLLAFSLTLALISLPLLRRRQSLRTPQEGSHP